MKKLISALLIAVPLCLFGFVVYTLLTAPPEPPADWRLHMTQEQHDAMVAPIDHAYRVAAYSVTWAIQLGYLSFVIINWRAEKGRERDNSTRFN